MSNRKPEQILWDRMRGQLGLDFLLKRIENIVDDGMPDVVCQSRHRPHPPKSPSSTTFIELKVAHRLPVRDNTQLLSNENGLRQSQKNWLLDWSKYGGRSWVLIGIAGDSKFHIAVPGMHGDHINGASLLDLINLDGAFSGAGKSFWLDFGRVL